MIALGTVLIVDSDEKCRGMIFEQAVKHGEIPMACSTVAEARSLLSEHHFKAVFCGDNLSDGEYTEVIRAAKPTPVVVLSRVADWESYLPAMETGAFDYIACPPHEPELDRILSLALHAESQPVK
jgi:DNA-binding NtrC family response regulator